jgi:hypothetical protein
VSIKDRVGWPPLQQALIMYWYIQDIWSPTNLVALTVTELDDTLPRFTDDRRVTTDSNLRDTLGYG